jgi:hypothetical protein
MGEPAHKEDSVSQDLSDPSMFMTEIELVKPSCTLVKAMLLPSGDHVG